MGKSQPSRKMSDAATASGGVRITRSCVRLLPFGARMSDVPPPDYIDSPRTTILAYDFDLVSPTLARSILSLIPITQESGTISNERTFATSDAFESGVFDGLCMDAEGAVWAARWGSCRVVRYLPDGTLDTEVIMPKALNVTCCIFGGRCTVCALATTVLMIVRLQEKTCRISTLRRRRVVKRTRV